MKLNKDGLIAQTITAFNIIPLYYARTICSTFWLAILSIFLLLGLGGIVAASIGWVLGGIAAAIATLSWTPPAAAAAMLTVLVTMVTALSYAGDRVTALIYSLSKTEVSTFIKETHKNYKEKHCTLVEFE